MPEAAPAAELIGDVAAAVGDDQLEVGEVAKDARRAQDGPARDRSLPGRSSPAPARARSGRARRAPGRGCPAPPSSRRAGTSTRVPMCGVSAPPSPGSGLILMPMKPSSLTQRSSSSTASFGRQRRALGQRADAGEAVGMKPHALGDHVVHRWVIVMTSADAALGRRYGPGTRRDQLQLSANAGDFVEMWCQCWPRAGRPRSGSGAGRGRRGRETLV